MISEYELKRKANIERNNDYLQSLGINTTSKRHHHKSTPRNSNGNVSEKKRKLLEPVIGQRKSSRLADKDPVNYKEDSLPKEYTVIGNTAINGDLPLGTFNGLEELQDLQDKIVSDTGSCSSLNCNYRLFLDEFLCKPVSEYGKAAVMQLSNFGKVPKFNKYPGVIEWANCLYLWVNIGGKTGYVNNFSESGKYMMWYGGSKMKADSRVTLRLTHPNNNAQNVNEIGENSNRVLLFVRLENENYCCLGEVRYVAVDMGVSPIQIKWELVQHEKIRGLDYFQRILHENQSSS